MVSLNARNIIAKFAELSEDIKYDKVTDDEYVISLKMGEKYYRGSSGASGQSAGQHQGHSSAGNRDTTMILHITRETLHMTKGIMKDSSYNDTLKGTITVITEGTYSEFNKPFNIKPVPVALRAPEQ